MGTFKKWAKTGFPQSEVENSLDPRHVGSTVTHAISVLERTRCVPMCSNDISGRCTPRALESRLHRGRIHPLCFQKHLLYIHYFTHNTSPLPPPIYRAQVTHLLHFLLLLQITCKKTGYFFHIQCSKERVKQGNVKNCYKTSYKTSGSLLHPCPSAFLHIFVR